MNARTGDMIEQAAQVIHVAFARRWMTVYSALREDGDYPDLLRDAAQALADAGLLRQEPPTRDEIARAIANHYGTRAGRDNAWDATTDRQRTDLLGVADAVLALLRGGAR